MYFVLKNLFSGRCIATYLLSEFEFHLVFKSLLSWFCLRYTHILVFLKCATTGPTTVVRTSDNKAHRLWVRFLQWLSVSVTIQILSSRN